MLDVRFLILNFRFILLSLFFFLFSACGSRNSSEDLNNDEKQDTTSFPEVTPDKLCDIYYLPGLEHDRTTFYFELNESCEFEAVVFDVHIHFYIDGGTQHYNLHLDVTDIRGNTVELRARDYDDLLNEIVDNNPSLQTPGFLKMLTLNIPGIRAFGKDDILYRANSALDARVLEDIRAIVLTSQTPNSKN